MLAARSQYRIVLERAEQSAQQVADQAMATTPAQLSDAFAPVPEIEYVRTYARVAQVQLRAVLEALAEQIDLLGEVPKGVGEGGTGRGPATPKAELAPDQEASGDVDWSPGSD